MNKSMKKESYWPQTFERCCVKEEDNKEISCVLPSASWYDLPFLHLL